MKYLIIILVILFTGCSTMTCFPYKDTKDPQDAGAVVEWRF